MDKRRKATIGAKKLNELKHMPRLTQRLFRTRDGRWVVNETTISCIKPVEYYEKVLESLPYADYSWND